MNQESQASTFQTGGAAGFANRGGRFEDGIFIKAKRVNVDRLPEMDRSVQKMEFLNEAMIEVLKGEDNPEHSLMRKIEAVKQYHE